MTANLLAEDDWVPAACTLPSVEQPLRRVEFDDLFANDVVAVDRTSPREVRLELRADAVVAARAASLATKETACCSFFTFELTISDGEVVMVVSTLAGHERVLEALAERAGSRVLGAPQ